jgi:hypothetical protein
MIVVTYYGAMPVREIFSLPDLVPIISFLVVLGVFTVALAFSISFAGP